jgi:high-affinity Fe2+/Pb2+ permease
LSALDSGGRLAQDAANPSSQNPQPPVPASPGWRWFQALALLAAGIVLGLAFAAYGGANLLLEFTNLRYCG